MKWNPEDALPGDMIRVKLGAIYHYGVFVSEDEVIQFGLPPIPENKILSEDIRVLATDIDTFCCSQIVERAILDHSEQNRRIPPEKTIEIARSRIGEDGYDLLRNNCEHFASECVMGEKISTQVEEARRRWELRRSRKKRQE